MDGKADCPDFIRLAEWRIKYLNYKAGKKYVKAVSRAVYRANGTPRNVNEQTPSFYTAPSERHSTANLHGPGGDQDGNYEGDNFMAPTSALAPRSSSRSQSRPTPVPQSRENEALTRDGNTLQYGSIDSTPPSRSPSTAQLDRVDSRFELPAPAMQAPSTDTQQQGHQRGQRPPHRSTSEVVRKNFDRFKLNRSASASAVPRDDPDPRLLPKRLTAAANVNQSPSQLRRLFSHHGLGARYTGKDEMRLRPFDLVREREAEFYSFMDSELDKVENFYKMKEDQAGQRLTILKDQLHEMRNRRIQEIAESSRPDEQASDEARRGSDQDRSIHNGWVAPIKAKIFPVGPNSKAFGAMPRTPLVGNSSSGDAGRDYIRRPEDHEVSYRTAKRKLKLAFHEFYRGLELLKSYSLLNRTAFRKLNKKFDKAVNARPPYRYMNEHVNKAWFVQSDVLEGHIKTVEDLYARYFERGNRKIAVGKLRSLTKKHGEQSGSAFQSGFLIGTGLVFTVQGVIYGGRLLFHDDPQLRQNTSYLLQVYGGYFLMLLLFSLFCINCMIWEKNKINYPFIFEFDQRHHLDWRTLSEFPSFFLLVFGIIIWANFSRYGPEEFYLYYPVVLLSITAIIIFLPFPIIAHRARKWFAYSHVRSSPFFQKHAANNILVAPPFGWHIPRGIP